MTIYVKELLDMIDQEYGRMDTKDLTKKLFEIGVVDHTMCKVLAVRKYVENEMKKGEKKIDAMWNASERFSCTYEYIRKCVYYYTDVNIA